METPPERPVPEELTYLRRFRWMKEYWCIISKSLTNAARITANMTAALLHCFALPYSSSASAVLRPRRIHDTLFWSAFIRCRRIVDISMEIVGVCCTSATAIEFCKTVTAFFFRINIAALKFITYPDVWYPRPHFQAGNPHFQQTDDKDKGHPRCHCQILFLNHSRKDVLPHAVHTSRSIIKWKKLKSFPFLCLLPSQQPACHIPHKAVEGLPYGSHNPRLAVPLPGSTEICLNPRFKMHIIEKSY